ncbi:MAG: DUF4446 family protein [Eubacterium sp.]|nr:DUF4446 family protein [Eubacterium sp.]
MFHFSDYGLSTDVVLLGALAAILILLILCLVLIGKNSSLRKRYDEFMQDADGKSLEDAFQKKFENMDYINEKIKDIDIHLEGIDNNLLKTYQKVGIVKYDAFKEVGGTLSFVMTLLTKENDGFIMNSMHSNKEGCYIYIKEVKAGEVFMTLSEEERQSLEQAMEL